MNTVRYKYDTMPILIAEKQGVAVSIQEAADAGKF